MFNLVTKCPSISSLNVDFKLQVEFGEHTTQYAHPRTTEECEGKKIDIYGRNLINPDKINIEGYDVSIDSFVVLPISTTMNGETYSTIEKLGVHYFKGTIRESNNVYINGNILIKTPLLKDDKFTFIFNVTSISEGFATIKNPQIVYGHTDYEEYLPYEVESTESLAGGYCDLTSFKYPYSLLSIHNFDSVNDGLAVYIKFDPALSRDWTEKQLSYLNKRIDTLESIIKSLTN